MKTTLVRLFVLTLAVAGFGASSLAAHARSTNKAAVAPLSVIGSQTPCAPSDPSNCGIM